VSTSNSLKPSRLNPHDYPEGASDPVLFGCAPESGLVAVEVVETDRKADAARLFFRAEGGTTVAKETPFTPFIIAEERMVKGCPGVCGVETLTGAGPLNRCLFFGTWRDCLRAKAWLVRQSGFPASAPEAPYLFLNDPVQQHLMLSGRTLFKGMRFEDLRRLQVDIECLTSMGYEFCNADRAEDRIIAIGLADQSGWEETLWGSELSEKELLERFVTLVRERDPDVIEGHNIFNFDLPYLAARARLHGIPLALGRDGSEPRRRASRFTVGERIIAYERFDIHGRHVVDTLFLAHAYDVAHRSLDGFGLKEVARHFGLAAHDRTYIDGGRISQEFMRDLAKVRRYLQDDVWETQALSGLLSPSNFIQTQMLPFSYQNVCVRGSAAKIDALMIREYLRQRHALPRPDQPRPFAGGYTAMFVRGVVRNVHHCDIRSLYPSLMLVHRLGPRTDELGVFLKLLEELRARRLAAKTSMQAGKTRGERLYFEAFQSALKLLINSFYGYLGFTQARFNDFDAAERITQLGRELLHSIIAWMREQGATPIEIDTDGIYFVPPPAVLRAATPEDGRQALAQFQAALAARLPQGIEIEFDAEYVAMYSYKMKNYATLDENGEIVIKGAALKSRGLEPFQRDFLRELIRLKLEGRTDELPALKARYEQAIRGREWPIEKLAKTERLQDAAATYAAKVA